MKFSAFSFVKKKNQTKKTQTKQTLSTGIIHYVHCTGGIPEQEEITLGCQKDCWNNQAEVATRNWKSKQNILKSDEKRRGKEKRKEEERRGEKQVIEWGRKKNQMELI